MQIPALVELLKRSVEDRQDMPLSMEQFDVVCDEILKAFEQADVEGRYSLNKHQFNHFQQLLKGENVLSFPNTPAAAVRLASRKQDVEERSLTQDDTLQGFMNRQLSRLHNSQVAPAMRDFTLRADIIDLPVFVRDALDIVLDEVSLSTLNARKLELAAVDFNQLCPKDETYIPMEAICHYLSLHLWADTDRLTFQKQGQMSKALSGTASESDYRTEADRDTLLDSSKIQRPLKIESTQAYDLEPEIQTVAASLLVEEIAEEFDA